ncbi:hypothetical protein, conserved [Trypanosoma brucei brucei TREU927]|uniref:Uncharacterized protein n=1 Tax=Trypanosoma brucei brucei (strain 927/4 GUTat10.1) TaxID=185431 RepID=Q38DB0_TRYB2|nr:hypothetical protein, conserved [Trypanosoma brucei brucei TREU927]EAN77210.1 hypothetical protein, conserved [Trypanosoma brucei brucei TREU927]
MENSCPGEARTPPRNSNDGGGGVEAILTMQTMSPLDKVRQFFEEQEVQLQTTAGDEQTNTNPLLDDVLDTEPIRGELFLSDEVEADEVTASHVDPQQKKRKRQGTASGEKGRKESRKARRATASDDTVHKSSKYREKEDAKPMVLFRQSQKALRKEARHVSMKEVLCRSLPGLNDGINERSNLFTPSGVSQASSTWSSAVAADITNRFLSNVQQKKKETFERLLQREMTNSQLSFSSAGEGDASLGGVMGELVIGDESAVMTPPASDSNFLAGEGALVELTTETAPSLSSTQDPFMSCNGMSQGFVELDEETEQAQSDALVRKHELWRLRQRHLRAQRSGEESNPQVKLEKDDHQHKSLSSTFTGTTLSTLSTGALQGVATHDADGAIDTVLTHRSALKRTISATLELSTDHIDMIRRANSFDNISCQRIVVFEAKKGK